MNAILVCSPISQNPGSSFLLFPPARGPTPRLSLNHVTLQYAAVAELLSATDTAMQRVDQARQDGRIHDGRRV